MTQISLKNLFFIAALSLSLTACSSAPKDTPTANSSCEETRGSVDMGSGSTKALVALVDFCQKKILKVTFSEQTPIGFKESLEASKDNRFDTETIEEAQVKYSALIASMRGLGAKSIKSVATAAFRKAANGPEAAGQIAGATGVPIAIISQAQEAEMGVRSALILSGSTPESIAVWDIGGGSMQMSYFKDQKLQVFEGDLASVSFKNAVIKDLQKKNPEKVKSPNPLRGQRAKAVQLSSQHALKNVSGELKSQSPSLKWVGIGGVWWHSLRKQVPEKDGLISAQEIERALKKRSSLRDTQIGGNFAETEVTNLALVLGYMKALKIKEVKPLDAALNQGLLFE